MKVGDTVWVFDSNHRVYRPRLPGEAYARGGPIWREHWRPRTIVGENARSWILNLGEKVPKKNPSAWMYAFSEQEIDDRAWVEEHRHRLVNRVQEIRDAAVLREIARLIGYESSPPESSK
jgi:hypothetical protein